MPRLFIAIDLPESLKASLCNMFCEIPGARWVGAAEIHLTLRFIGEVAPSTFAQIKSALSTISFAPFPLSLAGVGHFPPKGHPRVLWVGLERSSELFRLQRDIEIALQGAGVPAEERPFSPHITLARLKDPSPALVARFEAAHSGTAFAPFETDRFVLYSSVLTPRGAIHKKEQLYPGVRRP